jgi:GH35 family endo-1,4-beta-xylanase
MKPSTKTAICGISLWYNQPGIGVGQGSASIEQAFRWAHEADPHTLLLYNAGDEDLGRKSDAIYAMVKDFKRRGVPIDGVGPNARSQPRC